LSILITSLTLNIGILHSVIFQQLLSWLSGVQYDEGTSNFTGDCDASIPLLCNKQLNYGFWNQIDISGEISDLACQTIFIVK
jgi:hypothetical protein